MLKFNIESGLLITDLVTLLGKRTNLSLAFLRGHFVVVSGASTFVVHSR